MNITKEIREAHHELSDCSIRFLEFVEKTPHYLQRSNYTDLFGINLDEGPVQPWPTFINQHTKNRIQEAGISVFDLIKRIPARLFDNDVEKMSQYYEIPAAKIARYLQWASDRHLANIVARADFIFSPSSGVKCLEYNVSAGIGGWQLAFMEPYFLNTPVIAKFLQEYQVKTISNKLFSIFLENFLNPAIDAFSTREQEINIAVVSSMFGDITVFDIARFIKVKEFINKMYKDTLSIKHNELNLKGEILFCDLHNLNIVDNCIYYKAKKIHVLVEMYHGSVPPPILEVFKAGNVLLYNGPVTVLLSNKLNLALLSENEDSDVFTPGERKIIKKYIPWTRKIVPGEVTYGTERFKLEDFVLSHRETLVIKPAEGLAGEGVYVGRYTSAEEWEGMVELALLKKNWLVQEYIESYPYLYQCGEEGYAQYDSVWGIFVFGSEYGGGFLRIVNKEDNSGVINVHQGAEVTPLLEVEE